MSQPFKLYRLQQIDIQIDHCKSRLREIEINLNNNEELVKAKLKAQEAYEDLALSQKALHRAEEDVKSQRIKIEQTDATLYGGKVKNPKELQDLQNESASLRRYLLVLEDRQLETMIRLEESEQLEQVASKNYSEIQDEINRLFRELLQEKESILNDMARLDGERQAAASGISEINLDMYTRLRQTRRGVAVSRINNKACSACGSMLSTALLSAAHSPLQITRCESCGRILYTE